MIGAVVGLLRPIYAPVLRLKLEAPHLPEDSGAVQVLKPSEKYLTYQYVKTLPVLGHGVLIIGGLLLAALTMKEHNGVPLAIAAVVVLVYGVIWGFALVAARLDWELRHYVIGDRSLRVRQGALTTEEVTLSYANVQNVEVMQGPIERWLGFSSVKVTTAGASSSEPGQKTSHGADLTGLVNATEIRELILKRMREQKDTGLGDLDDKQPKALAAAHAGMSVAKLEEVLAAAKALRHAAES
jgi:membrane protein YdbS with pleckstrin-like domain